MTDRVQSEDTSDEIHRAVLTLHEAAGTFKGVGRLPGFARPDFELALVTLAEAPPDEATVGSKLDTLVALAGADFPRYEEAEAEYTALAAAIGAGATDQPLDTEQVLSDAKAIALGDAAVADTETGRLLPHHYTAMVGEDVCHIVEVAVNGIDSVWVFSEFETDADFGKVADWVKPQNWPKRGSAMFKGMDVVGGITQIGGSSFKDHWHAVFLEDVQLIERLKTLLHCDYVENPGRAAGMTYALTFSVGHKLSVDRGFLLAQNIGTPNAPLVRVKALKIVSFTNPMWNEVAKLVCPFWTDFVRQAAEGGGMTRPRKPDPPSGGDTPPASEAGELCRVWIDFFGDAAKEYAAIAGDVVTRMVGGDYKMRDATSDGTTYWSQLAKDWAKAWSYGMEMMEAMASKGLVAPRPPGGETDDGERFVPIRDLQPSAASAATAATAATAAAPSRRPSTSGTGESVIVPVPDLSLTATVECGPLVGIESDAPVIPADAISTEVVALDMGGSGIRVTASTANVAAGLYTGEVSLPDGTTVPVALYVSHASATP